MIRLNRTTIWKDFSQYISKYMALKVWSPKCFEQCICTVRYNTCHSESRYMHDISCQHHYITGWWWSYHSLTAHQHQKGHTHSAKTGDSDCNVNSSRYSLRTALCESIWYQAKSEQNIRQDLIPWVRHGEAALMHHYITGWKASFILQWIHYCICLYSNIADILYGWSKEMALITHRASLASALQ